MNSKEKILIAGGTGLIGQALSDHLKSKGYTVNILTRQKSNALENLYQWDIKNKTIDSEAFVGVSCVINLVGAGIADKKWSEERKKEIITSRIEPAHFLAETLKEQKDVNQYISASGINCYGYDDYNKTYVETDPFGNDYLSQVVKKWENAADSMPNHVKVAKIRTSVVLTDQGGALPTIAKPIKWYVGSALGSGKQWMPWITLNDLSRLFEHAISNKLTGTYNALAATHTNKAFTKALAKALNKPLWLPNVPSFALKIFLGEMASMVLEGLKASNEKIKTTGFDFEQDTLELAFSSIYKQ